MIDAYENGRSEIEKLINSFHETIKDNFNEAKTRFLYIDTILTKVLGWDLATDIYPEDSCEGSYCDYKLSLFRPVVIWEAKKVGIYFEIPSGIKNIIYPIKSLYKDNPSIRNALNQVGNYCHERGVPVGVVSNGWQFIAFIANRNDSIPPLEGDALVIPSLESFLNNYKNVWNCLSKPGFEDKYLQKLLLGSTQKALPQKMSSTIENYPGIKNRNPFQTELEIISDLVLEDIIKEKDIEKEFLENCYCKSGSLSQYSLVSRDILNSRYNYLFESNDKKAIIEKAVDKKGLSNDLMEIFANSFSKRPILLIGDVGVGKSTFIDNLLMVEAPQILDKSITFKIDLGSKAIITLDIRRAVLQIIREQLIENYGINIEEDNFVRHCYFRELEEFKKNVRVKRLYETDKQKAFEKEIEYIEELINDKITHLKRSFDYINKSQKKQTIIFIDNCDQRNDSDQETAFLVAQEFATDWPVIVFVCLRPETFHRTKKISGALSGYHTKAFTISPPRIDDVIQKRLIFAQKITSGEITLSKLSNKTSFTKLHQLIETFKYSLEINSHLYTFIENVSNGNIRKAIELIKKFFGSGHVDTQKIIRIIDQGERYIIPLHEMIRSVIFGDNIYYNPNASEVVNLFDVRSYDIKEHFIVPICLGLLFDHSNNNRNHGFIIINDVYTHLQSFGYNPDQIDTTLNFMYSKGLFETSQRGNFLHTDNSTLMIRTTNLGVYHLHNLINSFTYIDSIIVDVPIFDDDCKHRIFDSFNISVRLDRVIIFKEYLDNIWQDNKFSNSYFKWNKTSAEIEIDVQNIKKRLQC